MHNAEAHRSQDNFIEWICRIRFRYIRSWNVLDYLEAAKIPDKLDTPSVRSHRLVLSGFDGRFMSVPVSG